MKCKREGRNGFTLIELIMVIVIIGILVLVALPRYYANVDKAKKAQAYATLRGILDVSLTYYTVYGAWPGLNQWPIIATVDGEVIAQLGNPINSQWKYYQQCQDSNYVVAAKLPGEPCSYGIYCSNGTPFGTCTP